MATESLDFLESDQIERQPRLHRSRSGSYADHLEEKATRDRINRDREMKRYHQSRYGSSPASRQQSIAARSNVLILENKTIGKNQSTSGIERQRDEPSSKYKVHEVRPATRRLSAYDVASGPVLPTEVCKPHNEMRPKHRKKSSTKIETHQGDPRSSGCYTSSPKSPRAQPQLQYQYSMLQSKLSSIVATCIPYLEVEAASPRDLTFAKLSDYIQGFLFDLSAWASIVNINNMARIDSRKRQTAESASRNLDRLIERTVELGEACKKAKPKDLKFEFVNEIDEEKMFDSDHGEEEMEADAVETLAFIIHSCLHSIQVQIQTLKRLARSLQEASPDAKEEVLAIGSLVDEVNQYFGSQEALNRHGVDGSLAGKQALDAARAATPAS